MAQFMPINFFLGFLQFLLGFSKVPVFCVTLYCITGFNENVMTIFWCTLLKNKHLNTVVVGRVP